MTETAPSTSIETAADGKGSERQAPLQERHQVDEEKARLEKAARKAVKSYHRERQLRSYQAELIKLQQHVEERNERVLILFEGRDAAGRRGTIRRVTRYLNPRHYRVVSLGRPTEEQRSQWFLQRYVAHFPTGGEIVLFDRSWYSRAMVEPVFGFCTDREYELFMRGVVGFEKDLVRQGITLIKLYFSVSKGEQARRFARRKHDRLRQWKLSEVDIQSLERWDEVTELKYKMLRDTHTSKAPWTVIRADDKHKARLNVMKVILNAVPYDNRDSDLEFVPDPKVVITGAREIEIMKADRLRSGEFAG